jgi:hypothetical protein
MAWMGLEKWKSGMVEECDDLIIRQFDNSTMEEWKSGKMEECDDLIIRPPIAIGATMEEWNVGMLRC